MNREDAELRVNTLDAEFKKRAETIAELEAEVVFEQGLLDQFSLEMSDANKTEADRAFAREQFDLSSEHIATNNDEIQRLKELQDLISGELDEQRTRLQGAVDFLQDAEDAKARADLERERENYNDLKGKYEELKT